MAYIIFHNKKTATISAAQGKDIWAVLTGEIEPNEKQEQFANTVDKIYLNWRNAPDSYLHFHADTIKDKIINTYFVDNKGKPTRPDYSDKYAIRVGKILGMF